MSGRGQEAGPRPLRPGDEPSRPDQGPAAIWGEGPGLQASCSGDRSCLPRTPRYRRPQPPRQGRTRRGIWFPPSRVPAVPPPPSSCQPEVWGALRLRPAGEGRLPHLIVPPAALAWFPSRGYRPFLAWKEQGTAPAREASPCLSRASPPQDGGPRRPPRAGGAHAPRPARPGRPVLGLDAGPQHVLPPGHVRMLPDEVLVVGQRELPAPADAHHGHVLQEVLHVLRAELRAAGVRPAAGRPAPAPPLHSGPGLTHFCHRGHFLPYHPPALRELPHLRKKDGVFQPGPWGWRWPGRRAGLGADPGLSPALGQWAVTSTLSLGRPVCEGPPGWSPGRGWTTAPLDRTRSLGRDPAVWRVSATARG